MDFWMGNGEDPCNCYWDLITALILTCWHLKIASPYLFVKGEHYTYGTGSRCTGGLLGIFCYCQPFSAVCWGVIVTITTVIGHKMGNPSLWAIRAWEMQVASVCITEMATGRNKQSSSLPIASFLIPGRNYIYKQCR
jgi:hypothetical protein